MDECTNCYSFVYKGKFCADCKNRSIDNKLKCVVCYQHKNMRFMLMDICGDCKQTHIFDKCTYCNKYDAISLMHNMCEQCMCDKCCYCLDEKLNVPFTHRYSWVFGNIVCTSCRNIKGKGNYICEQVHSSCSSQKYKCCICKDERIYERNCNSYKGYLDTVGTVYNLSRWNHYCPQCKEACEESYTHCNNSFEK